MVTERWLRLLPLYKVIGARRSCASQLHLRLTSARDLKHVASPHRQLLVSRGRSATGEGNQHDTLLFETLRGQLSVQHLPSPSNQSTTIQISLPKSDSSRQLPHGLKLEEANLKVLCTPAAYQQLISSSEFANVTRVVLSFTTSFYFPMYCNTISAQPNT